ncbi:protein FAR1-RELATED SEQUENCE 5 [Trifolium medium]|uniref:Protein FAR1-RELATED SEQUENCE 5 n=1 Tax=Trifolium medium TaxID=97028 RepID=A0A392R9W8_9FABA|nr:protein FAR1-RELATED SEQUENCE 5 [Trifolium medium]
MGQAEIPNDGPEVQTEEADTESSRTEGLGGCRFDDEKAVNSLDDITHIDFKELSIDAIMKYHFLDVGVTFMFYDWYASFHGYAGRKDRVARRRDGEIIQQTFVCYREEFVAAKKFPSTS